jgi:hypothetical protein
MNSGYGVKPFVSMEDESFKSYRGFALISFTFHPHAKKKLQKILNAWTEKQLSVNKKVNNFYIKPKTPKKSKNPPLKF